MNEQLIRNLIKFKFDMAEKVLDCLPQEIASEVKQVGKIVLEIANEEIGEQHVDSKKTAGAKNPDGKINNINIE